MGFIDTIGSLIVTDKRNRAQRQENARQREWEQGMANTAHQREVEDLKAAGLNPMLSGTGGAGAATPNVSAADIEAPTITAGQDLTSALEYMMVTKPQLDIQKANSEQSNATNSALEAKYRAEEQNTITDSLIKAGVAGRQGLMDETMKKELELLGARIGEVRQTTRTSAQSAKESVQRERDAKVRADMMESLGPIVAKGTKAIEDLITFAESGKIGDSIYDWYNEREKKYQEKKKQTREQVKKEIQQDLKKQFETTGWLWKNFNQTKAGKAAQTIGKTFDADPAAIQPKG